MTERWQDRVAGERMRVDQSFAERVRASSLSRQEWNLVMTAVEFRIEGADDPDAARLVADTSKLPHVLDELDEVEAGVAAYGPGSTAGSGGSGGLFDSLKRALGVGGGGGDEKEAVAERLAAEYADRLQTHLEENGRWEEVCRVATA